VKSDSADQPQNGKDNKNCPERSVKAKAHAAEKQKNDDNEK
jgi:hypothetical protein